MLTPRIIAVAQYSSLRFPSLCRSTLAMVFMSARQHASMGKSAQPKARQEYACRVLPTAEQLCNIPCAGIFIWITHRICLRCHPAVRAIDAALARMGHGLTCKSVHVYTDAHIDKHRNKTPPQSPPPTTTPTPAQQAPAAPHHQCTNKNNNKTPTEEFQAWSSGNARGRKGADFLKLCSEPTTRPSIDKTLHPKP